MALGRVGVSMSWGEAQRLSLILLTDPSSRVGASVRDWSHPITQADMTLRDWIDMNTSKKSPPYPRPWHPKPKHIGGIGVSVDEFEAMKRAAAEQN